MAVQGKHLDGTRDTTKPVYLDMQNYIDYMLLHIYSGADDWPNQIGPQYGAGLTDTIRQHRLQIPGLGPGDKRNNDLNHRKTSWSPYPFFENASAK